MKFTMRSFWIVMLAGVSAHAAQPARDMYPGRAVRLILPIAAGGGMDMVARAVGQKLSDNIGQTVVIDNRPGGGGSIGVELAANATPDGYTFLMMSSTAVVYALLYPARYDLLRDFVAVSQLTSQPYLLVVNPALPVKSVGELITYAKANPGKLNYASSGIGSLTNLTGELFKTSAGVSMTHVPYKTINAAFPDLLAGSIHLAFQSIVSVQAHVKAKRLRPLAVTGSARARALPETPTVAETGVKGFNVTQWFGVMAPARTPRAVVERLNKELIAAVQGPELAARLAADGAEAAGTTPEAFAAHVKSERDKWAKVIAQTGIRGE
jgi:tripartite-type tricarboxylate transporter receptor subunit TctC